MPSCVSGGGPKKLLSLGDQSSAHITASQEEGPGLGKFAARMGFTNGWRELCWGLEGAVSGSCSRGWGTPLKGTTRIVRAILSTLRDGQLSWPIRPLKTARREFQGLVQGHKAAR